MNWAKLMPVTLAMVLAAQPAASQTFGRDDFVAVAMRHLKFPIREPFSALLIRRITNALNTTPYRAESNAGSNR